MDFFGLNYMQLFAILALILALVVTNFEFILQRFFNKIKIELGESYWTYCGEGGIRYSNVKVREVIKTDIPKHFNIILENGITLPNVNMDENSSERDVDLVETHSKYFGVVDVYCKIDALGNHYDWAKWYKESEGMAVRRALDYARNEYKQEILKTKELKEAIDGTNNMGFNNYQKMMNFGDKQ